ncbi:MAG: hypothetical protein WC889_07040 [Myxococcota bacterium]|jgi:uncharacterized membrane protein
MKLVKIGIYAMIVSVLTLIATIPLGVGYISGIAFAAAMIFLWFAAILMMVQKAGKGLKNRGRHR